MILKRLHWCLIIVLLSISSCVPLTSLQSPRVTEPGHFDSQVGLGILAYERQQGEPYNRDFYDLAAELHVEGRIGLFRRVDTGLRLTALTGALLYPLERRSYGVMPTLDIKVQVIKGESFNGAIDAGLSLGFPATLHYSLIGEALGVRSSIKFLQALPDEYVSQRHRLGASLGYAFGVSHGVVIDVTAYEELGPGFRPWIIPAIGYNF